MTLDGGNINNAGLVPDMITGSNAARTIGVAAYYPDDEAPTANHKTRLAVRLSTDPTFSSSSYYYSDWKPKGYSAEVVYFPGGYVPSAVYVNIPALAPNTKYYVRIYIQYDNGAFHDTISGSFFTDRPPNAPTPTGPANNTQFDGTSDITLSWFHSDPDAPLGPPHDQQYAYSVRYRTTATPLQPAGVWVGIDAISGSGAVTIPIANFAKNSQYEWQVLTYDYQSAQGPWSPISVFFVGGLSASPTLISPIDLTAIRGSETNRFTWKFRDPDQTSVQTKADVRFREVGGLVWTTLTGTTTTPGADTFWDIAGGTFEDDVRYEWQARTYNSLATASNWSASAFFISVAVGQDSGPVIPSLSETQHYLGQGDNRVYLYERGGQRRIGEITPLASVQWSRKRDDISNALITTNAFGDDGGQLLANIRSWRHEIVIFRDGVRVWEGPVVRVSYETDKVSIEAKDVMAYVYRRIMRQAYNDSYRVVNEVQLGLHSVVYRARAIIMNALAYDDPNVLRYLTALENVDDTVQSRIVAGYTKSAWGEVDDLAATAGLDYTTVGRRIIVVDTHRQVGRLPEMMDGDFSDPPIVTEYGMQAANVFAVTNNSGIYGIATRLNNSYWAFDPNKDNGPGQFKGGLVFVEGSPGPEGYIEQIASAYGESAGAATTNVLTPAAQAELVATLSSQAERNIQPRWPVPVLVRIPDNSTLNPELNIGINQLVPGVWIPLRAVGTLRKVTQIQKLDSLVVTQRAGESELIKVIMSPAPMAGQADPLPPEEEG